MISSAKEKAASLSIWRGDVDPQPVSGGITNANFMVEDRGTRYFVRVGDDIPEHGVMRFNEIAASRAAWAAGVSPAVVYAEDGVMVLEFVDGHTLAPGDVAKDENLERIVPLLQKAHTMIPEHLTSPVLTFWVFQVIRTYLTRLRAEESSHGPVLGELAEQARVLESRTGPISLVFGHNDLLAANFIDAGDRLWLVDWDYAGFNSALFDLGGLASNNGLSGDQEAWLLQTYFGADIDATTRCSYEAMKCASLLRETLWSMVSETHSAVDFDYAGYTRENLERYRQAFSAFDG